MVKCSVYFTLIVSSVLIGDNSVRAKEPCDSRCVPAEECHFFGNLNRAEQSGWLERFECDPPRRGQGSVYGFSSSAKGDIVCCPENVWQVDDTQGASGNQQAANTGAPPPQVIEKNNFPYQQDYYRPNYNYYNPDNRYQYGNQYGNQNGNQYGNQNGNQYGNQYGNQNGNQYGNQFDDQYGGQNMNRLGGGNNRNDFDDAGGSSWHNRRRPGSNQSQNNGKNGNPDQCPARKTPPNPSSGCCGREANEEDRIAVNQYPNDRGSGGGMSRPYGRSPYMRYSDSEEEEIRKNSGKSSSDGSSMEIGNRIAGGKETDLEQFPWTALLKTTFSFPDKESAFSCGGSLISSRFILTAGHCVYDKKGTVKGVEVYLAEYDKRTFPQDCKFVLGRGRQCVENIVMEAEDVHLHPDYDDNFLLNDIALIKLNGDAPYTDYIRPVCLPPINIDSPELSHLRLAVAGWGRNGQYKSDIKQSTVVNLVPNEQCAESYPGLTKNQLCAAGYTGEDTCKGDSGGPLMMVYGGKFYVSGVVSGKRADAPCGTSVPSLYTNVYRYIPWIRRTINNN